MRNPSQPIAVIFEDSIIFPQRREVIQIRCKAGSQHIRIRIPAKPQAKAAPRQGYSAGNVRACQNPRGSLPLFSRYVGTFAGRTKFVGAMKAPRTSSLLNSSQEPSSGIRKTFENLLGLFSFHADQSDREAKAACAKNQSIWSKKL